MKKLIKRRLNSFKTQTRTLSENVSLNRTKIILNRKNAIIHNKSRKLFLTERQDKQMITEASRFRVARSLTASPLTRRHSTSSVKTKICCISRQTIKKFFERRTNSFTTCYSKLYASHDEFIHELFTHAFASMSGIISWKYLHVLELDLRENVTLNQTK